MRLQRPHLIGRGQPHRDPASLDLALQKFIALPCLALLLDVVAHQLAHHL
jgi:hypothetical protein